MPRPNRAFTLLESLTSITLVALLLILLIPAAGRVRNADGFEVSMANLAVIMRATAQYHADHAGRSPMRGCSYTNGQLSGAWDTWNIGGKNCRVTWAGQIFDEPAHSRFLNAYLYQARIPQPPGYINTGSGPTWRFIHGTPTPQQRLSLEMPVFRSPGEPGTGITSYEDVGTSYHANMKWWDSMPPGTFAAKYEEGLNRINQAFNGANPSYVFIHDQKADVIFNSVPGSQTLGQFGKINASMMGLADGRVGYTQVLPGFTNTSGPGYTFLP